MKQFGRPRGGTGKVGPKNPRMPKDNNRLTSNKK